MPLLSSMSRCGSFGCSVLQSSMAKNTGFVVLASKKISSIPSHPGQDGRTLRRTFSHKSSWRLFPNGHKGLGKIGIGGVALSTVASSQPAEAVVRGTKVGTGPRVCILGGGFGGLYTAVRLENLLWPSGTKPQVTLVDRSSRFVFKPLLYELLNGGAQPDEVAPLFSQLLAPYSTNFVQGSVKSVELDQTTKDGGSSSGGRIHLADSSVVEFDWLVLALGSDTVTFGIPGVKELALPFATFDDAMRVLKRLEALEQAGGLVEVAVVGAGYAGIELAATVAERLGAKGNVKVITATSDILDGSPPGQRASARSSLLSSGVSVLSDVMVQKISRIGPEPAVSSVEALDRRSITVKLPSGEQQEVVADLVLWTAGSGPVTKVDAPALSLPFPANKRGAMETDATLRVMRHARVFALGDVAVVEGPSTVLPPTAQVAFQQADYVAWNLWAAINGRPLLAFKYQHLGDMMSLGRVNGAVTLPFSLPDQLTSVLQEGPVGTLLSVAGVRLGQAGAAENITLDGPLAGLVRKAAYLYRQPTDEQRLRVGGSWFQVAAQESAGLVKGFLAGISRHQK